MLTSLFIIVIIHTVFKQPAKTGSNFSFSVETIDIYMCVKYSQQMSGCFL